MSCTLPNYWFELTLNPAVQEQAAYGQEMSKLFNVQTHEAARECISAWPGYEKTPLHRKELWLDLATNEDINL